MLSELLPEFPSRVRLGSPKPYHSRHLKAPQHFQNSLPLSTAGDASFSEVVPETASQSQSWNSSSTGTVALSSKLGKYSRWGQCRIVNQRNLGPTFFIPKSRSLRNDNKFLDNKISTFKNILSWRFLRKTAFWDDFPLCPQAPPNTQILLLLSSRRL